VIANAATKLTAGLTAVVAVYGPAFFLFDYLIADWTRDMKLIAGGMWFGGVSVALGDVCVDTWKAWRGK